MTSRTKSAFLAVFSLGAILVLYLSSPVDNQPEFERSGMSVGNTHKRSLKEAILVTQENFESSDDKYTPLGAPGKPKEAVVGEMIGDDSLLRDKLALLSQLEQESKDLTLDSTITSAGRKYNIIEKVQNIRTKQNRP